MFRLLQVIDILLFFPILALGLMAGFSGGGNNIWFQRIGTAMLWLAPASVVCVIIAEILWRLNQQTLAFGLLVLPIMIWVGLIIALQIKTKFFFRSG